MKTRNGFVSNSSSTSFCAYGAYFNGADMFKAFRRNSEELYGKFLRSLKKEEQENLIAFISSTEFEWEVNEYNWPLNQFLKNEKDIHLEMAESCEGVYVGIPCTAIKDDETGKEFKDRASKIMKDLFGVEAEHIQEEVHSS